MIRPPDFLAELIDAGRWPRDRQEEFGPHRSRRVSAWRIKRLAPGETMLCLYPPPFRTVRDRAAVEPFWSWPMAAPWKIDFDLALVVGDFGIGSDAPIVLDYRPNPIVPSVIRLCWSSDGKANHWVEMAPDLATFALEFGL